MIPRLLSIITFFALSLPLPADYDFEKLIQPVPASARFEDPGHIVWCGTVVRDDQGKHHLFYSRWPRKLGHYAWVTHSEVTHAVADNPLGPYKFVDVALPARGKEFWDGLCTHNPTVMKFGSRYYLYYMGNTGDGKAMKTLNWTHRNNQRIGVAVADSPNGPWTRTKTPLIWYGTDRYWAIVKDFSGSFTDAGTSLALFESPDGFSWKPAAHPLVSTLNLKWADGTQQKLMKLERPQLLIENGEPTVLFCAAAPEGKLEESFNVQIPLTHSTE